MKNLLFLLLSLSFQGLCAQSGCHLVNPDSLRVLEYPDIFEGDSITFIVHGGCLDSTGWYVLYYDHCCEWQIGRNTSGIFRIQVNAPDIFITRIESDCDSTFGVNIDLDVYRRPTNISSPSSPDPLTGATLSTNVERDTAGYDLLGRKISGEHHGFYVIKKRLFFK